MQVFCNGPHTGSINFADENNVLLGYNNTEHCCANGGWFISDKPDQWTEDFEEKAMDLPGFNFDVDYFKEWNNAPISEGGAVQFRIVKGDQEKFITIYNCHNGYYSSGFSMAQNEKEIREGSI